MASIRCEIPAYSSRFLALFNTLLSDVHVVRIHVLNIIYQHVNVHLCDPRVEYNFLTKRACTSVPSLSAVYMTSMNVKNAVQQV